MPPTQYNMLLPIGYALHRLHAGETLAPSQLDTLLHTICQTFSRY